MPMLVVVGNCGECGAPIYGPEAWSNACGEVGEEVRATCDCLDLGVIMPNQWAKKEEKADGD